MDNVTHSLAAVLIAEAVCEARGPRNTAPRFRTTALWASVLANNLPDLDFAYRSVTPGKLGYLLQHRGHTHTVVGALALAAVALALVLVWARARGVRFGSVDRAALAGLALFGSLLHIVFDFQNNYGVHPFWPLDDRWYYGDTLFIVEPLLWAVALPAVALLARSRVWVLVAALVFAGGLGYGARSGAVQPPLFAGLVVVAAVVTLVLRGRSRRGRVAFGLFAWTAVMLTFAVSSHAVDRVVRDVTAVRFPDTKILDVVRTPSPGNPLCWSVISIGRESERYVARVASVSLVPAWVDPAHCAPRSRGGTAPLVAIEATDGGVSWRGEFARPTSDLKALSAAHCDAAAFLRYSRAPFWTDDTPPVIGDLRFDRSRALEFAEFPLSRDGACPPNVPPWEPPRRDLLGTR